MYYRFQQEKKYPVIIAKAMHNLLQFPTSCLCQQASPCLTNITNIMSKETVCWGTTVGVCQKFDKEFNICAKRKKTEVSHWK